MIIQSASGKTSDAANSNTLNANLAAYRLPLLCIITALIDRFHVHERVNEIKFELGFFRQEIKYSRSR